MKSLRMSLLILFSLMALTNLTIGKEKSSTANKANSQSLWIVEEMPRYGGDSELGQDDIDELGDGKVMDNAWIQGIIGYFAMCLLVPAISFLICPFFFLCRCCKCCCCKLKQPKNYTQISAFKFYWIPFIFIILCCIVMVVFSGLAYNANAEFSDVLLYRGHGDPDAEKGKNSNLWDIIVTVMEDGASKIDDISDDVRDLKPIIMDAIDDVRGILQGTEVLENGTDVLIAMLAEIEDFYGNKTLGSTITSPWTGYNRDLEFECEFCKTISTEVGTARVEIQSQTSEIFTDLANTVDSVSESLFDQNETILEGINDFRDILSDTKDQLIDIQEDVNDQRPTAEDYNDYRETTYNAFFAIPLVPIILVVLGGFFKISFCFTCGYILLWLTCVIMFGLLAIHMPIAALMSDMCDYLDMIDDNVTKYYNDDIGKTFQACLDNSLLSEVLGLDDQMNFTNEITFPTFENVSESFNFQDLNSFNNASQNTSEETFYGAGDEALITINQMIENCTVNGDIRDPLGNQLFLYASCLANFDDRYDRSNVSICDPGIYYDSTDTTYFGADLYIALSNLTDVLLAETVLLTDFNSTIERLQSNLTAVQVQSSVIESDVVTLVGEVNNASDLLNPVFDQVDVILDNARCGFIGKGYVNIHYVMCTDVMGVIARIVVAMIVVGVISIFACCAAFKMVRRTYWLKNLAKTIEKDKILQQQQQHQHQQPGAKQYNYNYSNNQI